MNSEEATPDRRRRTRAAVLTIATVVVIVAPIIALFAGEAASDGRRDWGAFARTASLTWLIISGVTFVAVTIWLWLGWDTPDTDSMGDEEVTP